jgi:putative ABC transport system permease protein
MIVKENLKEAVLSLASAKQRSLLALIGIVIGVGSVIAMLSIGTIVQNQCMRQFKDMGTDIITVAQDGTSKAFFRLDDVAAIPDECVGVLRVAPHASIHGNCVYEQVRRNTSVIGLSASAYEVFKLKMAEGRFLSDLDEYMFFCVLSRKMARELRKAGVQEVVGTRITFDGKKFTVIGVLEDVNVSMMRPFELKEGILIPITTSMRFPDRPKIQSITVKLSSEQDRFRASDSITNYFAQKAKGLKIRISSAEDIIESMQQQMQLFTLLLGAIGSISLIVGGVGVMNVMLVSVSERRREIGIRRALGAQQTDIQAQFLTEAVILCIIGGLLGSGLGVGGAYIASRLFGWEFIVYYNGVILGVCVSCLVGLFFGFYPARQASKLSPIEALRYD